jgi:hypothetical protein
MSDATEMAIVAGQSPDVLVCAVAVGLSGAPWAAGQKIDTWPYVPAGRPFCGMVYRPHECWQNDFRRSDGCGGDEHCDAPDVELDGGAWQDHDRFATEEVFRLMDGLTGAGVRRLLSNIAEPGALTAIRSSATGLVRRGQIGARGAEA